MKLPKNYFPEQAAKEYGSFYIWMRLLIISAWVSGLLALGYGQFSIMGYTVLIPLIFFIIIGGHFMIFHYVRYLRNYKRQE